MNTMIKNPSLVRSQSHKTHTLKLLLKREFWEHKGGFFWAPLISGGIFLLFQLIGGGALHSVMQRDNKMIHINGDTGFSKSDWARELAQANAQELSNLRDALTGFTMMSATWPIFVFGFVVFFYLVNAMFEERKDKSVLFWKSLPVSDAETVISKVLTALVVAPVIAGLAAIVVMLGSMLMFCGFLALNGVNPFVLYLANLDYVTIVGSMLLWIPVYALWALPTAGWLLMVSAWAKRVPFLWAVGIPLFVGVLISWFNLLRIFNVSDSWYWKHIAVRTLTSAFPGSHVFELARTGNFTPNKDFNLREAVLQTSGTDLLMNPSLWIGAVAGVAMIYVAIRLRRFRDEG
ncbi:hypothetical protein G7069_08695 [Lysobacter sp. HDW10]|jgi:ABC-2 type transport system permease protein|uniref:hypothetical protein n=1 Tax=Lysobacter sp. HDW10 TaxID=2714936 RepID=UPI00140C6F38|nr:hypothetical protein [Lysobacter sp. HDW10]QIK81664.1 hypothetical protein G7069_08695 [Lysobacter sp. HDW10]